MDRGGGADVAEGMAEGLLQRAELEGRATAVGVADIGGASGWAEAVKEAVTGGAAPHGDRSPTNPSLTRALRSAIFSGEMRRRRGETAHSIPPKSPVFIWSIFSIYFNLL